MNISVDAIIILSGVTTALTSIVGFFLIRLIKSNDDFQKANSQYQIQTTKEINEIKFNYLDRFDKVKTQIIESEKNIISNIAGKFRHFGDNDNV